jgi:filamentous hemagglutinin
VIAGTATGEFLERVTLTQATKDVRAGLPSDPRRSGNVAAAQINIEGLPAQMAAHSDINQAGKGVVGKGSGNFTSMELPNAQGVPVQRSTDSEYKILDNIADRLGNNTSATGTVKIVTERPACDSCLDVANQFRAKYPNIDVQIYDNNGVMLTKTPKVTPYFKPENVGKH